MTKGQAFAKALDASIDVHFGESYKRDDALKARLAAYEALVASGMMTFSGAGISIPDRDPIVETRRLDDADAVNALLSHGWRLLGADVREGYITAFLGRPKSVEGGEG